MGGQVNSPAAPSNLSATGISISAITLSWQDNSSNESGFAIDGALFSAGPWTQIATAARRGTSYTHTGLNPSMTCFYRVRAYNSFGSSGNSNNASATTDAAPAPPCTYSISSSSASVPSSASTASVDVTADLACPDGDQQ